VLAGHHQIPMGGIWYQAGVSDETVVAGRGPWVLGSVGRWVGGRALTPARDGPSPGGVFTALKRDRWELQAQAVGSSYTSITSDGLAR
jgi:hypothetical protein